MAARAAAAGRRLLPSAACNGNGPVGSSLLLPLRGLSSQPSPKAKPSLGEFPEEPLSSLMPPTPRDGGAVKLEGPELERCLSSFGSQNLLTHAGQVLLAAQPKQIAMSGPSGFLGSRVLRCVLDVHEFRKAHGQEPGELLLLSSSPGKLMARLTAEYGRERMSTIRACRVDYYHQHDVDLWLDQLGSLGLGGEQSVFVNLAAMAGPVPGRPEAMMAVNYKAPLAAAQACEELGFGHFIQSSTQAVKAERGGQVPYSRWKGMADFALSRRENLPVSVLTLGLLYDKDQGIVGQRGDTLNLVDLTMLPLTPIMGDGSAPLQPLEVRDAAERLAFLALSESHSRPIQRLDQMGRNSKLDDPWTRVTNHRCQTLRIYDAVGPEKMSMLQMMQHLARVNGNKRFRPVFVDYRNMERILNVASLGNLNRQFVSLLRSEQDGLRHPVVGHPAVFEKLLGPDATLVSLTSQTCEGRRRYFPFFPLMQWLAQNPRAIWPGAALGVEILVNALFGREWVEQFSNSGAWQRAKLCFATSYLAALVAVGAYAGSEIISSTVSGPYPPSL